MDTASRCSSASAYLPWLHLILPSETWQAAIWGLSINFLNCRSADSQISVPLVQCGKMEAGYVVFGVGFQDGIEFVLGFFPSSSAHKDKRKVQADLEIPPDSLTASL